MPHKTPRRHKAQSALPPRQSNTATGSSTAPCPGFPLRASRSVCHNCMSSVTPCGNLRGFPGSPAHLFLHATACGLRRTSTPLPDRVLLCCLRCTLKPSASATSLFRSCTSASGSAISPTAYRILCLRLVHLVRPASRQYSAMDPRLDTGGWLALTRRGLPPRKMRRALPGAITFALTGAGFAGVRVECIVRRLRHGAEKYESLHQKPKNNISSAAEISSCFSARLPTPERNSPSGTAAMYCVAITSS